MSYIFGSSAAEHRRRSGRSRLPARECEPALERAAPGALHRSRLSGGAAVVRLDPGAPARGGRAAARRDRSQGPPDEATMTTMTRLLERDGLVERRPDQTDGRAALVFLTARGRAFRPVAVATLAALDALATSELTADRVAGAKDALRRLQDLAR